MPRNFNEDDDEADFDPALSAYELAQNNSTDTPVDLWSDEDAPAYSPPGEEPPRRRRFRRRTTERLSWKRQGLTEIDEDALLALNPTALRIIELSGNELEELPETLGRFINLATLDVSTNRLRRLPHGIWNSNDLAHVDASFNQLIRLPAEIQQASRLEGLLVNRNRLSRLPAELGQLDHLRVLDASDNLLLNLPKEVSELRNLRELNLSGNEFDRFPEPLSALRRLETLDLSGNHLTHLPETIGTMKSLRSLNLAGNKLEDLPAGMGDLHNLRVLDLSNNSLKVLPKALGNLPENVLLNLDGNNLSEPLGTLVGRGTRALLTYLRSLTDSIPQFEAKLLLVGEGNVGKSSLLAHLRGEEFIAGRLTTHGIELNTLRFPHPKQEVDIVLNSWDFGGQPVYRISHQFFLTKRALYLVVWNPREGIEENQVVGWCRRVVLRVGTQARFILVATHSDVRRADFDSEALARQFPGMIAGSFSVSSKTGEGFDDLRHAIAAQAARLPQMGEALSDRWVSARREIESLPNPYITRSRFERICASHGLDEDSTTTLGNLLHDLGHIIHYSEDDGLRDLVVLQPEWLTKAIGFVLEDKKTAEAGGILDHSRLKDIWSRETPEGEVAYAEEHFPYFLRLMEKFDVSYRLNGGSSLVAQLVPHTKPPISWSRRPGDRTLRTICRLSAEAQGLVSWLTVRNGRFSTSSHWRRGIYLEHAAYSSKAILQLGANNRDLQLTVMGPSPDYFFHVLKDGIEELITTRWAGLSYDFLVPCEQRDPVTGRACAGYFRYHTLNVFRQRNEPRILCEHCVQWNVVQELLTGYELKSPSFEAVLRGIQKAQDATLESLGRIEQRAAESAHQIRIALKILSAEVSDCPRLFTLRRENSTRALQSFSPRHRYRLVLWCEEPGQEHSINEATYVIKAPKEWLVTIAPYLKFVVGMLKVAVPISAAIAPLALPDGLSDSISEELEAANALAEAIPEIADVERLDDELDDALNIQSAILAEGSGLRALREALMENDPDRGFGGLRRVVSPSGDILWVCPKHYGRYDPGLPRLRTSE